MRGGSYVRRNNPAGWPVLYSTCLVVIRLAVQRRLSPDPATVAEPSFNPLQLTFEELLSVSVGPPADPTLVLAVAVHPFASVTVTVYVPEDKLAMVGVVPPPGDHE